MRKKLSQELAENQRKNVEIEMAFRRKMEALKAKDTAREESLRIALITNEVNAGRISEIAAVYNPFLYGTDGIGIGRRIKALETAANVGYETPEETVEAARIFADHLSGKGETK